MPNDIYFRNHHEPISRPLPFAVFAAVYSGAPLFSLFLLVVSRCYFAWPLPRKPRKSAVLAGIAAVFGITANISGTSLWVKRGKGAGRRPFRRVRTPLRFRGWRSAPSSHGRGS